MKVATSNLRDWRPPARSRRPPLRLVVAVRPDQVVLFSASGLEGTAQRPRLVVPRSGNTIDVRPLTAALEDIVLRRGQGTRSIEDRQITVVFDPTAPAQIVGEVLAAIRTTDASTDLFPDILLSVGVD